MSKKLFEPFFAKSARIPAAVIRFSVRKGHFLIPAFAFDFAPGQLQEAGRRLFMLTDRSHPTVQDPVHHFSYRVTEY